MRSNSSLTMVAFGAAFSLTAPLKAGATFTGIGTLPGSFASHANAVSADGQVVVGYCLGPGTQKRAFLWSAKEGMIDLGTLSEGAETEAHAASSDGTVVVGTSGASAFRWVQGEGMTALDALPGAKSSAALDVSGNGDVIVGYSGAVAVRWTSDDGVELVETVPGAKQSVAHAISDDGLVVAGSIDFDGEGHIGILGFRWTESQGMAAIGPLDTLCQSEETTVTTMSADGSVLAGNHVSISWGCCGGACTVNYYHDVFRWNGVSALFTSFSAVVKFHVRDMNGDGSAIVGSWQYWEQVASAWSSSGLRIDLDKRLESLGIDLAEWNFLQSDATGISADGQTIVGTALHNTLSEAWIAHVPPPLFMPGDVTGNSKVDVDDLLWILNSWGPCSGEPYMCPIDLTNDGSIDVDDLVIVMDNWSM